MTWGASTQIFHLWERRHVHSTGGMYDNDYFSHVDRHWWNGLNPFAVTV